MRRVLGGVAVLAGLVLGGVGSAAQPRPAAIVTASLKAAQKSRGVHFALDVTLTAKLDRSRLALVPPPLRPDLERYAPHPLRLKLTGVAAGNGFDVAGTLSAGGAMSPFRLRVVNEHFYVRDGADWYALGKALDSEAFGGLVPAAICVQRSEGCARIEFTPAIASGLIGRLVRGAVTGAGAAWRVSGHIDAGAFTELKTGETPAQGAAYIVDRATYLPYQRSSRIVLVVDRRTMLARRLELSYRLDRRGLQQHLRGEWPTTAIVERTAHVGFTFSRWGDDVSIAPPVTTRKPDIALGLLLQTYIRAFGVFI